MNARAAAIEVLARLACAEAIRDCVHLHASPRKLPKADMDAVRDRARQLEAEMRPTVEAYELAFDVVAHSEVGNA